MQLFSSRCSHIRRQGFLTTRYLWQLGDTVGDAALLARYAPTPGRHRRAKGIAEAVEGALTVRFDRHGLLSCGHEASRSPGHAGIPIWGEERRILQCRILLRYTKQSSAVRSPSSHCMSARVMLSIQWVAALSMAKILRHSCSMFGDHLLSPMSGLSRGRVVVHLATRTMGHRVKVRMSAWVGLSDAIESKRSKDSTATSRTTIRLPPIGILLDARRRDVTP
ncbi:hypothetical protein OH76DRAFT_377582 [Lentinus brumalis]|uniref:Uncharacterized protein n=1 Tax=Lentinus brumalis TaxID=2498619 RepID=A0A371DUV7_9APHY|nr:hypothetical protein OH76DRAFT_377582 [Polyporus brumalis]